MTFAPSEVQIAVYNILRNDSALVALIGAPRIFDFVPQDQPYPYIVLHVLPFTDRGNATGEGLAAEFQISVWTRGLGRGNKDTQAIQSRIDDLLHKADLSVNGWDVTLLRRSLIDILTMDDNVTKQGIQRFKLQIGD